MLKRWRQTVTFMDIVVWAIGGLIGVAIVYGTIQTVREGRYTTGQWINLTIDGLKLGGIFASIALGYSVVYGILRMINFAHSEVFMSGPFTAVFLAMYLDKIDFYNAHPIISLFLVTLLSAAVSVTVALLLERVAYRRLRYAPRLVPLITAIGASFFLQYPFRGLYGNDIETYPNFDFLKGTVKIGSIAVPKTDLLVF